MSLGSRYNDDIVKALASQPRTTTELARIIEVDDGALTTRLFELTTDGVVRPYAASGSAPVWELTEAGRKRRQRLEPD